MNINRLVQRGSSYSFVDHQKLSSSYIAHITSRSGVDQEIEEGRGVHIELGVVRHTEHTIVCAHSILGGSWSMLPQQNIDHMRVLSRPLQTTITMQNSR